MVLKDKVVLIISQQDWGEMFISKHHYAVELANLGNKVFFIEGPDQKRKLKPGSITIAQTKYENVYSVKHRLPFPYIFKFKMRWVYDYLLQFHIRKLLSSIGKIDLVWSFDLSDTIPLRHFPSTTKKLFMPVDELSIEAAEKAAETADAIFSVTTEILQKFESKQVPKVFLNHGVSEIFINNNPPLEPNKNSLKVGLSGNFLRSDIDKKTLMKIINENTHVSFCFWGSVDYAKSNIAYYPDKSTLAFIEELKSLPNVVLKGQVAFTQLAKEFQSVDCFLICYDVQKDQSGGTNYHKILEYLATGKTIVSNNVSTYRKHIGLIEMADSRTSNDELPAIFKKVIENIEEYNSVSKQQERIAFAKGYTYKNQIKKIASYLN